MSVETRPLYVEDQVESLPYARPENVAGQVLDTLHDLTREKLEPERRLQLLELYGKAYAFLLATGQQPITSMSLSAFERNRRLVELNRRIGLAMGFAYQQTIGQATELGSQTLQLQARQRTLAYLCHTLMHCYHEYLPVPAGLWDQIHSLARQTPGPGAAFPSPVLPGDMQESMDQCYRRILLVSLVDPFHLNHGEIWTAYHAVRNWLQDLQLLETLPDSKPCGRFFILPQADTRPAHLSQAGTAPLPAGTRYLDTNRVLQAVARHIQSLAAYQADTYPEQDPHQALPGLALLKRMSRTWGLPPRRHAPRAAARGQVEIACGLSAAHHFISGTPNPVEDEDAEQVIAGLDETGANPLQASYVLESWHIANQGPSGFCLFSRTQPSQLVRVGDVFAMRKAGDRRVWSVGAVRWLCVKKTGEYQLGAQMIGHALDAVALLGEKNPGPHPGLLLAAQPNRDRCSLLVARGALASGERLHLQGERDPRRILIDQILESTPVFEQYNFHYPQ